jgi:predicted enzyme related to lactoylglutathione lyase
MRAMSIRTSPWPAGVPCWVDLMVPDVRGAGAFYSAVVGWEVPEPDEQYGGYVVAHRAGHATAGIGPLQPGARTGWTLYFATDDADATSAAAEQAGGTVLLPPVDVGPLGRMALVVDPSGASFGLWQAATMIGAALVNEPGGLTWADLRSTDPSAAQAFYSAVFGFHVDPLAMAGPDYGTFRLRHEQAPLGGMGGMMGSPEGTPSHWLVYVAVADTDAALAAAEQAGGAVVMPAKDTAFGRIGGVRDPYGAELVLIAVPPGAPVPDRAG